MFRPVLFEAALVGAILILRQARCSLVREHVARLRKWSDVPKGEAECCMRPLGPRFSAPFGVDPIEASFA